MNTYLLLKWLHVLSSTVLFGTGIGIAFFKWMADRGGDMRAIRQVNDFTVLADWIFTTPAVVIQPLSGLGLALVAGYPMNTSWLVAGFALYLLAGLCWLPVLAMQLEMRKLSRQAAREDAPLPPRYHVLAQRWFWLGIPAFLALIIVFWLMVAKPALW